MVADIMTKCKFLTLSFSRIAKVAALSLCASQQCHFTPVPASELRKSWERRFRLQNVPEPRLSAFYIVQHVAKEIKVSLAQVKSSVTSLALK